MSDRQPPRHWRTMLKRDLVQINAIANAVHIDYPEDDAVFVERYRLYPEGCYVLIGEGRLSGYLISHPWHYGQPPALNKLLQVLPERPTTYYLHDIALLPGMRKSGAGGQAIRRVVDHALRRGFENVSLVAVNHSTEFWIKQGFSIANKSSMKEKLKSYGEEAFFMVRRLSR